MLWIPHVILSACHESSLKVKVGGSATASDFTGWFLVISWLISMDFCWFPSKVYEISFVADPSTLEVQIQSLDGISSFNASHTIQWVSRDIAAGNQCVHCCTERHHIRCNVVATPLINLFLKTASWQIWKKVVSRRVAMKNFLLGSEFCRPVSLLLIVATIIDSSLSYKRELRDTDFGHMTSPWQQCRSMRIKIKWRVRHTHF